MRRLLVLLALAGCTGAQESPLDRDGDGSPAGVDCDDFDGARTPGAVERCDGVDEDCDDRIDEDATDAVAWLVDADEDGYGDDATAVLSCLAFDGRVTAGGDCDDNDPDVSPGAAERCDGVDEDCDGSVDDAALDGLAWFPDLDGDGHGASSPVSACEAPAGHVASGEDCDDADDAVFPGAPEACDGVDTDCDGLLDVGASDGTWFWDDADADGYGDRFAEGVRDCAAAGRAENRLDCDDGDAAINPADGGCGLDGSADAGDAAFTLDGLSAGALLGTALRLADLDGDGVDELLVGAPGVGGGVARVFSAVRGDEALGDARATLSGRTAGSGFGSAFAAGDLDGDGAVDLVVGAPEDDTPGTSGGAAFLFSGAPTGALDTDDALPIYAPTSRDAVGAALAVVGDTDGDGVDDLALGAPEHGNTGRVYLLRGPLTETPNLDAEVSFGGLSTFDRAGGSLAGGDLDGDGLAEVFVAAAGAGAVYVVPGGAEDGFSLADAPTIGNRGSAYLTGADVAIVPDVDGDGLFDVIVGGPGYSSGIGNTPGEAWVLTGPIDGRRNLPMDAWATLVGVRNDSTGASVAGGDLDGDGRAEVIVGAPRDDVGGNDAGRVYVVRDLARGTFELEGAETTIVGHAAGITLGEELAVGDLDGDGRAELAVGATGDTVGGLDAGAMFVFWGGAR